MGILLAFAPFIAFAVINIVAGSEPGLAAGLLVAALIVGRDWVSRRAKPKLLEFGTLILFGGLLLYTLLRGPNLSVIAVRLCVDSGLLLIILLSLLLRQPFTLQYAREQVAPEFWNSAEFMRTNTIITAAWALAFAVMVLTEAALLYVPQLPHRLGVAIIVLALVGAFKFTGWYPQRRQNAG